MKSCALLFLLLLGTSLAQSNGDGEPPSGDRRVDSPDMDPFATSPSTKDPLPTGTTPTLTPTPPTQPNPTGSTPTRSTDPTGSTPSKPTEPTDSTKPTKPTDSTPEPTKPTDSTPKPTKPTKPTDSTPKPTKPTKPTDSTPKPTKPTDSTPKPTKPTDSTPKPTKPTDSTPTPTKPTDSTPKPTKPTDSTPSTPSKPTNPTGTTPTTIPTTPTPPPTSPTPSSCGFVPDCPLRGTKYIANPCPDGCQKYFVCSEGAWESRACFPWENFHPQRLSCDFWFNVDCTWLRPTTPSPILTTWPDLTTPVPMTPRPPCNYVPSCPPTGLKVLPDPCGCQKFYQCVEGKAESKACMPWENFHPTKLECVFMFDVDCDWPYYDPTKEPTSTTPKPSTKPTPAPSVPTPPTPAPTQPTPAPTQPTPAPTKPSPATAPTAGTSAKPTTVDPNLCTFKPTCPPKGVEKIPIPCEGYCSKYFECSDGIPILRTCSSFVIPQKFHPTKKECQRFGVDCNWWKKGR